jgi:hypothetical protein
MPLITRGVGCRIGWASGWMKVMFRSSISRLQNGSVPVAR